MFVFVFFFIAIFSEIVGTVAGFGSSVFFVLLAGLFFDFHTVLALTSILHVFSNAAKLVLFGRHMQWRLLLLLGIPSIGCVILRALLSSPADGYAFRESSHYSVGKAIAAAGLGIPSGQFCDNDLQRSSVDSGSLR
jgi:uncharacterized membrane protein YfcA